MHHVWNHRNLLLTVACAALIVGGCCCPPPCCPTPCSPCTIVDRTTTTSTVSMVTPMPPPGVKPSGFLSSYGLLKKNPDREGAYAWQKAGLDLRVYDHLMIDKIQVILPEGTKVSQEIQDKAAAAFREILLETIDPYYSVVEQADEHVLRAKIALTDLVPAPEMEAGQPGVHTGGAELEGELVDARTGERLLMFVSRIEGSEAGTEAPKEWQSVEGAFREWAHRLLDYFDSWQDKE